MIKVIKRLLCYTEHIKNKVNDKYSSTDVKILPIKKPSNTPIDVPTYLKPLALNEMDIMYSKKHTDYVTFQDTVKFQNIDIHNIKSNIPIQFQGHVTMDPKKLKLKHDVISNGSYCQPKLNDNSKNTRKISKNNNKINSSHSPYLNTNKEELIIDFGECVDDFVPDSVNNHHSDSSESVSNRSKDVPILSDSSDHNIESSENQMSI